MSCKQKPVGNEGVIDNQDFAGLTPSQLDRKLSEKYEEKRGAPSLSIPYALEAPSNYIPDGLVQR